MDWPYLLKSFHGRIGRQTFWIAMLVVIVANFLACYAAEYIGGDRPSAQVFIRRAIVRGDAERAFRVGDRVR